MNNERNKRIVPTSESDIPVSWKRKQSDEQLLIKLLLPAKKTEIVINPEL